MRPANMGGLSKNGRTTYINCGNLVSVQSPYYSAWDLSSDFYIVDQNASSDPTERRNQNLSLSGLKDGTGKNVEDGDIVIVECSGDFARARYLRQLLQIHTRVSNDRPKLYKYYDWDDDDGSLTTYDKYNCLAPQNKVEVINFVLRCMDKEKSPIFYSPFLQKALYIGPRYESVWRMSELLTDAEMIHRKMLKQRSDDYKFIFTSNTTDIIQPATSRSSAVSDSPYTNFPFAFAADNRGIVLLYIKPNGEFDQSVVLVDKENIGVVPNAPSAAEVSDAKKAVDSAAVDVLNAGTDATISGGTDLASQVALAEAQAKLALAIATYTDILSRYTFAQTNFETMQKWFQTYLDAYQLSAKTPLENYLSVSDKYTTTQEYTNYFTSGMLFDVSEGTCDQVVDQLKFPYIRSFALALKQLNEINVVRKQICLYPFVVGIRPLDLWFPIDTDTITGKGAKEKVKVILEKYDDKRDLSDAIFLPTGCSSLNTSPYQDEGSYKFVYEAHADGYFREITATTIINEATALMTEMRASNNWKQMFGLFDKGWDTQTITAANVDYAFYSDKQDSGSLYPWLPPGYYQLRYTRWKDVWTINGNVSTLTSTQKVDSAIKWPAGGGKYSVQDPANRCSGVFFSYSTVPPCTSIGVEDNVPGLPRLAPVDLRDELSIPPKPCKRLVFDTPEQLYGAAGLKKCKYLFNVGGPVTVGVDPTHNPDIYNLTYKLTPITMWSTPIDQSVLEKSSVIKLALTSTGVYLPQVSKSLSFYIETCALDRTGTFVPTETSHNRLLFNPSIGQNIPDCANIYTGKALEWMEVQTNIAPMAEAECLNGDPPILVGESYYCPSGNISVDNRPYRAYATMTSPDFCDQSVVFHDAVNSIQTSWHTSGYTLEQINEILQVLGKDTNWKNEIKTVFNNNFQSIDDLVREDIQKNVPNGNFIRFQEIGNTTVTSHLIDRSTCHHYDASAFKEGNDAWWDQYKTGSSSSLSSSSESDDFVDRTICPARADNLDGECCVEQYSYKRGRIICCDDGATYISRNIVPSSSSSSDKDTFRPPVPRYITLDLAFSGGQSETLGQFLQAYVAPTEFYQTYDTPNKKWGFVKYFDLGFSLKNNEKTDITITTLGQSSNTIDIIPLDNTFGPNYIVDSRLSQVGKIGIFGQKIDKLTMSGAKAVALSNEDFQKFKIDGPYSSIGYDSKGSIYVFYEDDMAMGGTGSSSSSSSMDDYCLNQVIDIFDDVSLTNTTDQAQLDSNKSTNISVAVSYDAGITWFDYRGLIRLVQGETAAQPYVVSDITNNKIYLFFVFSSFYLAMKEVDCSLFNIQDAFKVYDPIKEFTVETDDTKGLEVFSRKGKALRQGYFEIIDGGPEMASSELTSNYWQNVCASQQTTPSSTSNVSASIAQFDRLSKEISVTNVTRSKNAPNDPKDFDTAKKYMLRVKFGRTLEYDAIFQKLGKASTEEAAATKGCSDFQNVRPYTRTKFAAYIDSKGILNVWVVDRATGLCAILISSNHYDWNVPTSLNGVCFYAQNPIGLATDLSAITTSDLLQYNLGKTYTCLTYNLNSFRPVAACYLSDVEGNEFTPDSDSSASSSDPEPPPDITGHKSKQCRSNEEKIAALQKQINDVVLAMANVDRSTEAGRQQYANLASQLTSLSEQLAQEQQQALVSTLTTTTELIEAASAIRQIQLAYDPLSERVVLVFVFDHGLYVRLFDNTSIQAINTGSLTQVQLLNAMKSINLSTSSPNLPVFLVGKENPTKNANLYIVAPNAKIDIIAQSIQPAAYFNDKGYLNVFYCDSYYSIWEITLVSPALVPYVSTG